MPLATWWHRNLLRCFLFIILAKYTCLEVHPQKEKETNLTDKLALAYVAYKEPPQFQLVFDANLGGGNYQQSCSGWLRILFYNWVCLRLSYTDVQTSSEAIPSAVNTILPHLSAFSGNKFAVRQLWQAVCIACSARQSRPADPSADAAAAIRQPVRTSLPMQSMPEDIRSPIAPQFPSAMCPFCFSYLRFFIWCRYERPPRQQITAWRYAVSYFTCSE